MIISSIPRSFADRLARLHLACDDERSCSLGHIGVRMRPNAIRFSATNGRILASVLICLPDGDGPNADLVLDRDQFTAAMKIAAKGTVGSITIAHDEREARISCGQAITLVRCIDGGFPLVDHAWTRTAGKQWVPTLSSVDPHLATIAQKIVGKTTVLFSSPVDPALHLDRLWDTPRPDSQDEALRLLDLRQAVSAPAYWSDHELAILVMPVTRSAASRPLELHEHALALPLVQAAVAA